MRGFRDLTLEDKPMTMSDLEWRTMNCNACGTIHYICQMRRVSIYRGDQPNAKALRDALAEKYMKKNIQNCLYLKKLFGLKLENGVSVEEHPDITTNF